MQDIQQLFPVEMKTIWSQPNKNQVNDTLASWLLDPNSLTARLKQHCQQFSVTVIGQEVQPCSAHEANAYIKEHEPVLVREVLLSCDGSPQVFARSLLPLASLTGDERQLAQLGEQPLGQVIFSSPHLKRGDITIAQFDQHSSVADLSRKLTLSVEHVMWGRRSLFFLDNKPLMVAEVFLPNAFAYHEIAEV